MKMGMMGVHPSGLHHLGDMCLIRHLCPGHRLKTRAKVRTLIPWFHHNQGSTRSEPESDDFYAPKTPSPRSPSKDALDSHRFFNPSPSSQHFDLYDQKQVLYKNWDDPSSPSQIRYNHTRHGRQLSWGWHNPTTEQWYNPHAPVAEWYHHGGHADLHNTVFKELL